MSSIAYIAAMDTVRTPSDIGNIVRARRKRLGWDQARLANEIGVSRQWVVDIEKGKPRAELQLILRALQALGLELMLGPGVAQAPQARVPDRGTVTPINLDAIVEHNRSNPPVGTDVLNAFNNTLLKNQFSSLDRLKNAGLLRPFSALDALKQSPAQAAFAAALNQYPSMINAPNEKHVVNEVLQNQVSALDRSKVGKAAKISKVISASSKKKGDP
ncbi:helix-turn-helix transcriptional regulator [Xanthomonas arboricola]|uniref:helix-turn-helix transcriptional regulator n=1 Tax=Xanthomonas arboricola TaxID=56448 RepID=UPI001EE8CFDB|nr:helix-turn-helix transcriptional regulator [Xanthomonas arboricola]